MAEAEYIDRNLIEWYGCDFEDAGCENRECSGCSHAECFQPQVMQIPTTDVVEREKIDKAIEEINGLIKGSKLPTVNIYNKYSEGLEDCLEILKRNIGE
jgi:hypothetical protein